MVADPVTKKRRKAKRRLWLSFYWTELGASMWALISREGIVGLGTGVLILLALYNMGVDSETLLSEVTMFRASMYALGVTLIIWSVLNIALSVQKAHRRLQQFGFWRENKFIYRQPVVIDVVHLSADESPLTKTLRFKEPPGGSIVYCRAEFYKENDNWNVFVLPVGATMSFGGPIGRANGTVLSENGELSLHAEARTQNASKAVVRVVVDHWEVQ